MLRRTAHTSIGFLDTILPTSPGLTRPILGLRQGTEAAVLRNLGDSITIIGDPISSFLDESFVVKSHLVTKLRGGCVEQWLNLDEVGHLMIEVKESAIVEGKKGSWYCKGWNRFLCDFCGKASELRNGCCSKNDFDGKCSEKMKSCETGLWMNSNLEEEKNGGLLELDGEKEEYEEGCNGDEDKVFDVLSLRKMIKMERRRANAACLELEKERMAAATAAEETMGMILRLQNDKSLVEMEANQYKRLAEEKQLHDQEVIQSLQWLVLQHESERRRTILEDQMMKSSSTKKLKPFGKKDNEGDHSQEVVAVEENYTSLNTNLDDAFHYTLFSSLDMDMSPE